MTERKNPLISILDSTLKSFRRKDWEGFADNFWQLYRDGCCLETDGMGLELVTNPDSATAAFSAREDKGDFTFGGFRGVCAACWKANVGLALAWQALPREAVDSLAGQIFPLAQLGGEELLEGEEIITYWASSGAEKSPAQDLFRAVTTASGIEKIAEELGCQVVVSALNFYRKSFAAWPQTVHLRGLNYKSAGGIARLKQTLPEQLNEITINQQGHGNSGQLKIGPATINLVKNLGGLCRNR